MSTHQEERFPFPSPQRVARELQLRRPPWWMVVTLVLVVIATWVPLALIFRARGTTSQQPRVHFFLDMDKQARFGPQSAHPWFVDGRAMRQPVAGTVARGNLHIDTNYYRGYSTDNAGAIEFVSGMPRRLTVDEAFYARGLERYQIYCAVCHGQPGDGSGTVNQRAIELKDPKWVPATNLLTQEIRDRADGQIFQAVSDGVRNMPSYKSQIDLRDRWAIVAHVRQLQKASPVAPANGSVRGPRSSQNRWLADEQQQTQHDLMVQR